MVSRMYVVAVAVALPLMWVNAEIAKADNSSLFLWDVAWDQTTKVDLAFTDHDCPASPSLTAGKPYILRFQNLTDDKLELPISKDFFASARLISMAFATMKFQTQEFNGATISQGGEVSLEVVPIRAGSWPLQCGGSNDAFIHVKSAERPFPGIQPGAGLSSFLEPVPKPLEPFNLNSHDQNAFHNDTLKGQWSLVIFGYTFCPDICPTGMSVMANTIDQLSAPIRTQLKGVFISIDPQRDTLERLGSYVTVFHDQIIGVTGAPDTLSALTGQVGARYLFPKGREDEFYPVDHTADFYLIDPQARLVARAPYNSSAEDLARLIHDGVSYYDQLALSGASGVSGGTSQSVADH